MSKFEHAHAAHCESGVMSSLLRHHGMPLSEAMVFGLANALTFAYLPFLKLGGMPLIAYRSMPKSIIKTLTKNLKLSMKLETFSNQQKGEERLDALLAEGKIVGLQSSVFWLPYFPIEMRFHFNAHNLLVFAKEAQEYHISDPVFEHTVTCQQKALTKARFVKGVMAPKGLLYYLESAPKQRDLKPIIIKNIKKTAKTMLRTPVPIAGLRGVNYLAKSILKLQAKDIRYAKLFLGHIVRMQEEIGTGGAGFRYIYASFLQESALLFDNDATLKEASKLMMQVGDLWREFALMIAKAIKSKEPLPLQQIAQKLLSISQEEAKVYEKMLTFSGKF